MRLAYDPPLDGLDGFVSWLNNATVGLAGRNVHIDLPHGPIFRGGAELVLPLGIRLVLQGHNTTLNVEAPTGTLIRY